MMAETNPKTEEGFDLKVRSRKNKLVSIHIPADTLTFLEKISTVREMSVEALIKLYIGQSMQQDLGFGDYTKERHKWLPKKSVEKIVNEIVKQRRTKRHEGTSPR